MSIFNKKLTDSVVRNTDSQTRNQICEKWSSETELLKGLKPGPFMENMAVLFENHMQAIGEMRDAGILKESMDTSNVNGFEVVAFPMLRRIFQKSVINELVSVQAMATKTATLYYFSPKISVRELDEENSLQKHKAPHGHTGDPQGLKAEAHSVTKVYRKGDRVIIAEPNGTGSFTKKVMKLAAATALGNFVASEWEETEYADEAIEFEARPLYEAYYASNEFDYGTALYDRSKGSSELVILPVGAEGSGETATFHGVMGKKGKIVVRGFHVTQVDGLTKIVGQDNSHNTRPMDAEEFLASLKVMVARGSVSPGSNANDVQHYTLKTGSTLKAHLVRQTWGEGIVNNRGELILEVDLSFPSYASSTGEYVAYDAAQFVNGGAELAVVYNKYASLEHDSRMGEVSFIPSKVTVTATTRKLRAHWTPELAKDMQAYHNIDVESELTALLSETIGAEIEREVIRDLRIGAAWTGNWDYNGYKKQTFYGVQKDWNQTFITTVNQISAQIQKSTLRGGANWILVSPEISAVFNDLEYFHVSNAAPGEDKYNMGVERIGSLQSRYEVFVDPYQPAGLCLIGRKGSSIFETGYIYAPYQPIVLTPALTNPNDFTQTKGIMTRYAKKMVNNRFYGVLYVDGIPKFDPMF